MKRWTQIFKAFGNINRLNIVKLLARRRVMTVSEIADELEISFVATSRHLIILHNLDVLSNVGRHGHVYYSLNSKIPEDLKKTIKLFL
jgi:DNA-binding transcriptional ArsR family regulator